MSKEAKEGSTEKTKCLIRFIELDVEKAMKGGVSIIEAIAALQTVHEKYADEALAENGKR